MSEDANASEQITDEVTSWPGVEAGYGKRGECGFRVTATRSATCTATTPRTSASARRSAPRSGSRGAWSTIRSSRARTRWRRADRHRRGRPRGDRADAAELRPRRRPLRLSSPAPRDLCDHVAARHRNASGSSFALEVVRRISSRTRQLGRPLRASGRAAIASGWFSPSIRMNSSTEGAPKARRAR